MQIIIKVISFIALLNICGFSQKIDTSSNPLKHFKWAVQFEVGNDFKLTSFNGLLISLKYHLSQKTALRFGTGIDLSNTDNSLDFKEYYSGYTGSESFNQNSQYIIFISNVLFYLNPRSPLKVFLGVGPQASFQHLNDERVYIDGYKGYRSLMEWNAGINAVFGCEWFPVNFMSLFGEYSVFATYGESKREEYVVELITNTKIEYYNLKSNRILFRGNIARLGISLYF